MRTELILLLAALGCVPQPVAPLVEFTPEARASLLAARDTVWRAWFAGDSALLMQILPDPMVGMGKPREAIVAEAIGFRENGGTLVSLTFSNDEFVVRGGMALMLSRYQAVTTTAGVVDTSSGQATEVFVLENGRWLNPYWHLHDQPQSGEHD